MEIFALIAIVLGIGYWWSKSNSSKNQQTSYTPPTFADKPPKKNTPHLNIKKTELNDITLSEEQQYIFNQIEDTDITAYVTGKAGTGKSILLQYFVANTAKSVAVVAPTGVAALNVGGQTIHSFLQLAPTLQEFDDLKIDYKTKEILRHLDTLVIDEISMVRADLMEAINKKLKFARNNDLPFGGVQVIMFGDLFQLPPVVTDGELRRYFDHNYGGIYFLGLD